MQEEIEVPTIITKVELINRVHKLVEEDGLKYSEAIIEICDELEIEYEEIAKLIGRGPLRAKLEIEAMRHHVIPNTLGKELRFE